MWADSAIAGEAVGLAMGLVMLGTGNIKALEDMIQYAHETQHEKIIRGLAVGMALIMFGRQEAADDLINGLLEDSDKILRYGGILAIAMAYCSSGTNKAIRQPLHVAVSDVNGHVRRLQSWAWDSSYSEAKCRPRMVELLSERLTTPMCNMELVWHWVLFALGPSWPKPLTFSSQCSRTQRASSAKVNGHGIGST